MTIDEKRIRIPFPPIRGVGLSDLDLQKNLLMETAAIQLRAQTPRVMGQIGCNKSANN
jgi:hypothetical protein